MEKNGTRYADIFATDTCEEYGKHAHTFGMNGDFCLALNDKEWEWIVLSQSVSYWIRDRLYGDRYEYQA